MFVLMDTGVQILYDVAELGWFSHRSRLLVSQEEVRSSGLIVLCEIVINKNKHNATLTPKSSGCIARLHPLNFITKCRLSRCMSHSFI